MRFLAGVVSVVALGIVALVVPAVNDTDGTTLRTVAADAGEGPLHPEDNGWQ